MNLVLRDAPTSLPQPLTALVLAFASFACSSGTDSPAGDSSGYHPGSGGSGAGAASGGTSAGGSGPSGGTSGGGALTSAGGDGAADGAGGATGAGGAVNLDVDADGCPLTLEGFATLDEGTTGGAGGPVVTVTNQADLEQYATTSDDPYVIRVQGTITMTPTGKEIAVRSNKTIIGVGTTGKIDEGGFVLQAGVENVILRNLTIGGTGKFAVDDPDRKNQDWDGVQMDTARRVWIDHCHFEDVYDGMVDVRMDSTLVTLSWNHFQNHLKTIGIGWTSNLTTQITLHHNWFDNCEKRNPNCDNAYCHSFNNILEGVDEQGSLASGSASLRIENGVFRDSKRAWYSTVDTALVTVTGSIAENVSKTRANGEAFDAREYYDYHLDDATVLDDLVKRCVGPRPSLGLE